ncbi:MAG: response regulator [Proteobacteria bacterium]|nr:response regulator [Pseudomonadota bacterium]
MAKAEEKKVLVVDDEPDVRSFLAACIEDAGFIVDTAMDGVEALEKVHKSPPDLITLDMVMPRKSGIRFMRELRADPELCSIPVIIITAHARDEFGSEDIRELSAFTARMKPKYVMEKPITPPRLVEAIADILGVETPARAEGPVREKVSGLLFGADTNTLARVLEILEKKG